MRREIKELELPTFEKPFVIGRIIEIGTEEDIAKAEINTFFTASNCKGGREQSFYFTKNAKFNAQIRRAFEENFHEAENHGCSSYSAYEVKIDENGIYLSDYK